MSAEQQLEIEHVAGLGLGPMGEGSHLLLDGRLRGVVEHGRGTKSVRSYHTLWYRFQDPARVRAPMAELDLGADAPGSIGDGDDRLPALCRGRLLGLGHLIQHQSAETKQQAEGGRRQYLVDLHFELPRVDCDGIQIDVLRVSEAAEEVAKIGAALQHVSRLMEARLKHLKERQVEELDDPCVGQPLVPHDLTIRFVARLRNNMRRYGFTLASLAVWRSRERLYRCAKSAEPERKIAAAEPALHRGTPGPDPDAQLSDSKVDT